MNMLDEVKRIKDLIDTTQELSEQDLDIAQALRNDEVLTEISGIVEDIIKHFSNIKMNVCMHEGKPNRGIWTCQTCGILVGKS